MDLKRKAFRVGIAAALCMLVSNSFKLKFPLFVLLPAVMPISTFFGETLKFGINRIIGSSIGALVGVILVNIQSQNIILIGLGVIVIIYMCNYLKWDSTTSIACLVFLSVMVGTKESAFEYSAHRLLDTFIGIAITTFVNNYLFNPNMTKLLETQAINIQEKLLIIANTKGFFESKDELNSIELEINNLKDKFKIYAEGVKFNSKFSSVKRKLNNIIYILSITFEQIKAINYININEYKNTSTNAKLNHDNVDMVITVHKNIFFSEMKNLDKIMDNIK